MPINDPSTIQRLGRTLLGLTLVASMWMPASSCGGYRDPEGKFVSAIPSGADSSQYTADRKMNVPIETADLTAVSGWAGLWPYLWVIPVLAFAWWRPLSVIPDVLTVVVSPLVVWLLNFRLFERIEYGTYVSEVAVVGLWFLSALALFKRWRARRMFATAPRPG